jgi:hypothetical protein
MTLNGLNAYSSCLSSSQLGLLWSIKDSMLFLLSAPGEPNEDRQL